jgi:hypothetical protein
LTAVTVNLVGSPFFRRATLAVVVPAPTVMVSPLGFAVTTYPVSAAPPSRSGGVQETWAERSPGVTDLMDGRPGTVRGVPATCAGSLCSAAVFAVIAMS